MNGVQVVEQLLNDQKNQSKDPVLGYWLVSMSQSDVEQYFPEDLKTEFDKLDGFTQKAFCSWLMDQMAEMFEESPEYGFRELLEATLAVITDKEIKEAMKENK